MGRPHKMGGLNYDSFIKDLDIGILWYSMIYALINICLTTKKMSLI